MAETVVLVLAVVSSAASAAAAAVDATVLVVAVATPVVADLMLTAVTAEAAVLTTLVRIRIMRVHSKPVTVWL